MTHHPQPLFNPSPENLAWAAMDTYRRGEPMMAQPIHTIKAGGLLADLYLAPGNGLVIAVQGTNDMADWVRNLDVTKRPSAYLPGLIHQGFAAASEAITKRIKWWLNSDSGIDLSHSRVWLCGHSLGGAIVLFLAPWLRKQGATVVGINTYGAPRVGNGLYVRSWNQQFARVHRRLVNSIDAVPHLPPLMMDYHHVAGLEYYDRHGTRRRHGWLAELVDKLAALWSHIGRPGLGPLERHDMLAYLELVKRNPTGMTGDSNILGFGASPQ